MWQLTILLEQNNIIEYIIAYFIDLYNIYKWNIYLFLYLQHK